MAPRWGGLRIEPYDPDARDADNDGIVQEGTAWERPVGTRLVTEIGDVNRGRTSTSRPPGLRIVDRDGNDVAYKPTYGTGANAGKPSTPTPLEDHGALPLREITPDARTRARPAPPAPPPDTPLADHGAANLKERGLRTVRDATNPNPPAPKEQKKPKAPKTPEKLEPSVGYSERTEPKELVDAVLGDLKELFSALPGLGGAEDLALARIAAQQGFDGKPRLVDTPDDLPDGHSRFYRGVGRNTHSLDEAAEFTEAFRTGNYFAGRGPEGAGTYLTDDPIEVIMGYTHRDDVMGQRTKIDLAIDPDAKLADYDNLTQQIRQINEELDARLEEVRRTGSAAEVAQREFQVNQVRKVLEDPGRVAALMGFDGYRLPPRKDLGGKSRTHIVLLNRGKATVVKGPSKGKAEPKQAKELVAANGKPLGYTPGKPDPATAQGAKIVEAQDELRADIRRIVPGEVKRYVESVLRENDIEDLLDGLGMDRAEFLDLVVKEFDLVTRAQIEAAAGRQIYVGMPTTALEAFLADGRYKSQFETGDSVGAYDPDRRKELEERQLGISRRLNKQLRPVYAFADKANGESPVEQSVYGRFVVELDEGVRERSTISLMDTFAAGLAFPLAGLDLEEGDGILSTSPYVTPSQKGWVRPFANQAFIGALRRVGADDATIERALEAEAYHPLQMRAEGEEIPEYDRRPKIRDDLVHESYSEIQIHGGFGAGDVRTIWIDDMSAVPSNLIDAAAKLGLQFRQTD